MAAILDMSVAELDETLASTRRPPRPGGAYSIFDETPLAPPNFDTPPPTNMARSDVGCGGRAVQLGAYAAHLHAGHAQLGAQPTGTVTRTGQSPMRRGQTSGAVVMRCSCVVIQPRCMLAMPRPGS